MTPLQPPRTEAGKRLLEFWRLHRSLTHGVNEQNDAIADDILASGTTAQNLPHDVRIGAGGRRPAAHDSAGSRQSWLQTLTVRRSDRQRA